MEKHNPKRKVRKSRKVLGHLREKTKKSADNTVQKDVNMSVQVRHSTNVPNMSSNRFTLAMRSYRNVVVSDTIRRNLASEKLMLSFSRIPYDRVSTQSNEVIIHEKPNGTQNIICERNDGRGNGSLPSSFEELSALFLEFAKQELPAFYRQTLPGLLNDELINGYKREARKAFEDIIGFHRDERSETEALLLNNQNDSLLNPMEYIKRGAVTESNLNDSVSVHKTSSQTNYVNIINVDSNTDSADSDVEHSSSTGSTHVVTPSPTQFATLSNTPQCEYFPHKLN
ncbi:hypothetical protein EVAR_85041_1 [Eumeta japonica]|uniref:Uncharacterized protein n=1 Tax=Eumeta variegata TaxID=151549 RepID=A0A4C1WAA5_EUMVA|nr:hypothetical protein EVAR_85041_1 [Eumeta japonica]